MQASWASGEVRILGEKPTRWHFINTPVCQFRLSQRRVHPRWLCPVLCPPPTQPGIRGNLSGFCVVLCVVTPASLPSWKGALDLTQWEVRGRKDALNPHKHCLSLSLGLLGCRAISDGFEIWHGGGLRFEPARAYHPSLLIDRLGYISILLVLFYQKFFVTCHCARGV